MSKTDKTAPAWVRVLNRPSYLEEHHDHTNGRPCDLPTERKPSEQAPWSAARPGCRWIASHEFWCIPENGCGCPACADAFGRKVKTRRNRRNGRQYAQRNWRREYE